MSRRTPSPTPARRAGFTLAEILVTLVLLSVVIGSLMTVIVRQQQFYRSTSDITDTRSQLRQGVAVLPADLRGVSIPGGDLIAASPTSVEFWATIGAGVVCSPAAAGATSIMLAPDTTLANGALLTSFLYTPAVGDRIAVMHDGAAQGTENWQQYSITSAPSRVSLCDATSGFIAASDPNGISIGTAALAAAAPTGVPVRILRHVKYELYQSATDGQWYLGYSECSTGTCTPQPVAGPFRPASSTSTASGLTLAYLDSNGVALASPVTLANVASIAITFRGQSAGIISMPGRARDYYRDSLSARVAIRNRQ